VSVDLEGGGSADLVEGNFPAFTWR